MSKIGNGLFISFLTFCIIIAQYANLNNNTMLIIIVFMAIIGYSIVCKYENLFLTVLFLLSSNRIFTLGPISILSIIMIVSFARVAIQNKIRLNQTFIFFSFIFLCYSLQYIFRENISITFDCLKIILMLWFVDNQFNTNKIIEKYERSLFYIITGTIIATIIALLFNSSLIVNDNYRFTIANQGQNVLGVICAVLIMHCIIMYLSGTVKKKLYVIFALLLIAIGLITVSRTFLLGLAFGICLITIHIFLQNNIRTILKVLLFFALFTIICFICYKYFDWFNIKFTYLINRVVNPKNDDISNGRIDIWLYYIQVLKSNNIFLLFGIGNLYNKGFDIVAHNMIIEEIASYGLIGSIIVTILYCIIGRMIRRRYFRFNKISFFGLIPLSVVIATGMVSHTLLGIPQTMMLYLGYISGYINILKK